MSNVPANESHATAVRDNGDCIGIETPHGRVMVGERRVCHEPGSPNHGRPLTVGAVGDYGILSMIDGCVALAYSAERVAAWPLVREETVAQWPTSMQDAIDAMIGYDPASRADETRRNVVDALAREPCAHGLGIFCGRCASWSYPVAPAAEIRAGQMVAVTRDPITGAPVAIPANAPRPAIDPRAAREARRCEIDAVLAEDAHAHPSFAKARRCAVMAAMECDEPWPVEWASSLSSLLRQYEGLRGGMCTPSGEANRWADRHIHPDTIAAYERTRAL